MLLGLFCALFAAACHGVASAMQAVAARRTSDNGRGMDPMLLVRLLRQGWFVASFGLNIVGLVAQVIAVHMLPMFLAQAALSASIAVTALCAARWFGMSLPRIEWTAVFGVCFGLALLGLAAADQGTGHGGPRFRMALLGATLLLGLLGWAAGQLPEPARSVALGLISGLEFGAFGLAIRLIPRISFPGILIHPMTYTVIISGILASWFFTAALQRGGVVVPTAMMMVAETVPPSVIGVVLLGDHARHGWTPVAILGFLVAVSGALALARFGEVGGSRAEEAQAKSAQALASNS